MHTAKAPFLLALCSTLLAQTVMAAAPAAAPSADATETLAADLRPLALAIAGPDDDPGLVDGLRPAIEATMRRMGLEPDPSAPHGVFIVVGVDDIAPDTHQIEVRLEIEGASADAPSAASSCTRCGSAGLLEHIERGLQHALEALPPDRPAPQPAPEPETTVEAAPPAPSPEPTPRRLGTRGIVGAALLGTGVASVATGAALWVKRRTLHPSRDDYELQLRRPAVGFMAAGGAAAVAGGVLLGLDLARQPSKMSAAPLFGGGLAGLSVRGRF